MGGGRRKPLELPKRSVLQRIQQKQAECTPLMISLFDCFRAHAFSDEKCASQSLALTECLKTQKKKTIHHKDSTFFHLIRLYNMRR
mmetsp:Transcript_7253/g.13097  ORF Transcript_7253/g.13097 Transcript_7253/m.13097 type:complete len:86 (+) Transcript_7253:84-341(+)